MATQEVRPGPRRDDPSKVLQQHYSTLVDIIQDPGALADSLYSAGVIARIVKEKVEACSIPRDKTRALVSAVQQNVGVDPGSFQTFIDVLKKDKSNSKLVSILEGGDGKGGERGGAEGGRRDGVGGADFSAVSADSLSEDDLVDVMEEVMDMASKWRPLGMALRLRAAELDTISYKNHTDPTESLRDMILAWLQQRYDTKKFGQPSWRVLCQAIHKQVGGNNPRLAKEIAGQHVENNKGGVRDAKKLYDEAMRIGSVDREIIKCLIIGAAGVGKTAIKHLLLGKDPPEKRVSTGVLENPVRAVSISMAGACSGGSWCTVENDDELMKMMAEAIKSGKVRKEENMSVGENDVVAEHNDDATDVDTVGPSEENTYTAESIDHEFIEAINKSKGGDTFLSTKWIHFIDSGGQPEFHDLLPLFIPHTSVVVFVFKLSESLHHKPKVEYFGSSGRIGDPCESYLTHKEILEHTLKSFHGQSPTILVIGTHKDLKPQLLKIEDLKECLNHMKNTHNVVYFGNDVPIALLNCLSKVEREKVIKDIRSNITAKRIESKKTPLAWFGLEMELKKASKLKSGILSMDECKKEADKFPFFKDNRGQFDAALQHLIQHNIFLHYPEILPDIVFCDPQVLLNEVTRIVQHHYMLRTTTQARCGDMISFVENGYISTDILQTINKDNGTTNVLEPAVLLKLLSHLNIISAIHISSFYLMPALLLNTANPALEVTTIPGKATTPPLCITFDGGCAPSGLFCSLVAHLLNSKDSDWKLYTKKDGTPRCCFHNCVAFLYGKKAVVTLMELFTHFRIYVQTPPNDAPLICQQIHDIVHTSIDTVHKRSKLVHEDAILCPSHPEQNHLALCSKDESIYTCTDDEAISEHIPEEYKIWKNFVIGDQAGVHQPSSSHAPLSKVQPPTPPHPDQKPTLAELQNITVNVEAVSIITEVADNWKSICVVFNFDPNGRRLKVIEQKYPNQSEDCCREMFQTWLKLPRASWRSLIITLEACGEATLAEQVKTYVGIGPQQEGMMTADEGEEPMEETAVPLRQGNGGERGGGGRGGGGRGGGDQAGVHQPSSSHAPLSKVTATPPSGKAPPDELHEDHHTQLFTWTKKAAYMWKAIGRVLGFKGEELDNIVRELGRHDDEDYYEAMLRRWLDWAPPNHSCPTLSALVAAIRAAGKEKLANELEGEGKKLF